MLGPVNMNRIFSTRAAKGEKDYLRTQKIYESLRTLFYFFLCGLLLLCSYFTTGVNSNLFLILSVLGALPSCKSAVEMIMYLRYTSMDGKIADEIIARLGDLDGLFDLVFTTHLKNHHIDHMVYKANCLYGYTTHASVNEAQCETHISNMLQESGHKGITVKIFKDLNKYYDRIDHLKQVTSDEDPIRKLEIYITLKCISL